MNPTIKKLLGCVLIVLGLLAGAVGFGFADIISPAAKDLASAHEKQGDYNAANYYRGRAEHAENQHTELQGKILGLAATLIVFGGFIFASGRESQP